MMDKSYLKEPIPTYEETMQNQDACFSNDMKPSSSQIGQPTSLPQHLSNVRRSRINAILTTYIDPLLLSQAEAGLFKTTLVFVPSNVSALQPSKRGASDIIEGSGDSISQDAEEAIIGFPCEDYVKLVRLHGQEYNMEFWRQPAVIKELETSLKARLKESGHEIFEPAPPAPPAPPGPPAEEPAVKTKKVGFFRRNMPSTSGLEPRPFGTSSSSGWVAPREEALEPGQVRLKIGLQDVALRVVTEMGLYDTKTGKAVVVNMEIGS